MKILAILIIALPIVIMLLAFYVIDLRRRIAGLDDERLWLSRRDRRAYARELRRREAEQYQLVREQQQLDQIYGVKR